MADESQGFEPRTAEDLAPDTAGDTHRDSRRSLFRVVVVMIVIVVIVLVLLMLKSCGGAEKNAAAPAGGAKTIVPVQGLSPEAGSVSVWVEASSNVESVLSAAGVNSSRVTDMGGGRYVVAVPAGTEAAAIKRLAKVSGVADAGLVYDSGKR